MGALFLSIKYGSMFCQSRIVPIRLGHTFPTASFRWLAAVRNSFSYVVPAPPVRGSIASYFNPCHRNSVRNSEADVRHLREFPFCSLTVRARTQTYATMSESSKRLNSQKAIWVGSQMARKRSEATLMYLVALVVAMVGCSYAAVPLYRKFCQATGYGGTIRRRETVEEKIARHAGEETGELRQLVVQFNADVADGMPWKFTPTQREVKLKPGQSTLAFYTAENLSSKPITGVSTYNVSPMKAGIYFNKIQCFCFEEQRLLPGEKIDMPVFFYIDPEFATDPKMDDVNSLILSYTFFKVECSEEEHNAVVQK